MSDLQLLFLVLAFLYGWECACWLGRGTVAFRTWIRRRCNLVHPGTLLGNLRGGFVFAHPFPPLGDLFTATEVPLALSPAGVLGVVPPSLEKRRSGIQTGKCVSWEQIKTIEAKAKRVLVNGEPVVQLRSPYVALNMAITLEQLAQTKPSQRETALAQTAARRFDISRIERQWQQFRGRTRNLRVITNLLFIYLFVGAPLIIWQLGFWRTWAVLLLVLLVLTSAIATVFRRVHKIMYPNAEEERFSHFLMLLLSPVTAIRAGDLLSRPYFESDHPLALAKVLCSVETFQEFAALYWRELCHPMQAGTELIDPVAQHTSGYWRALHKKSVDGFLKQSGLDPAALLQAPMPADAMCLSYCPRCLAQFAISEGNCPDCGGLALAPFQSSPHRRTVAIG